MDPNTATDPHVRDATLDASWHSGPDGPPVSPEISLDGSSPSLTWRPDEFTLHQGYQAYKEELRSLIFNTANSAAPTRQASPDADDDQDERYLVPSPDEGHRRETADILAVGSRVKYLRNYVEQVAPWVCIYIYIYIYIYISPFPFFSQRPSSVSQVGRPAVLITPGPSSTCSTATAPSAPR